VVLSKELEPCFDCCSTDAEAVTKLSNHLLDTFGPTWTEDHNIQILGQQRKLRVDLANVAQEVDDVPTVFILLPSYLILVS
jgi:hypothetical protein